MAQHKCAAMVPIGGQCPAYVATLLVGAELCAEMCELHIVAMAANATLDKAWRAPRVQLLLRRHHLREV